MSLLVVDEWASECQWTSGRVSERHDDSFLMAPDSGFWHKIKALLIWQGAHPGMCCTSVPGGMTFQRTTSQQSCDALQW